MLLEEIKPNAPTVIASEIRLNTDKSASSSGKLAVFYVDKEEYC